MKHKDKDVQYISPTTSLSETSAREFAAMYAANATPNHPSGYFTRMEMNNAMMAMYERCLRGQ